MTRVPGADTHAVQHHSSASPASFTCSGEEVEISPAEPTPIPYMLSSSWGISLQENSEKEIFPAL